MSLILRSALLPGYVLFLCGCRAPLLTVAGAYFPAWLACATLAVVVACLARAVMVATQISQLIPFQLLVCVSIGRIAALIRPAVGDCPRQVGQCRSFSVLFLPSTATLPYNAKPALLENSTRSRPQGRNGDNPSNWMTSE